ncbi:hypothetical protein LF599_01895 [Pseudodesulfovibrio thermohalotolerans]|uniref:hypothetical protein n=1 Tax=Pseudodesulfovibrio thermohalotolerans TaxID=2880651 RepID=UPI0022BA07D3|nr:hypothetical protein [Pseudodesulfovibrio thermohalotolerans]WFS62940.1 hypothetical protein LF599_01895 [Pseudodesulfovibrio thermohalotolerans]
MVDFAWNGIGLAAPLGWEPSAIERDGLLLADGAGPVCELKWNRVQGSFSFDKHLKRLTKGNRSADVRAVGPDEVPSDWAGAVDRLAESGLRARSFLWRAGENRGLGAALHHPGTGLACLIQFFIRSAADEAPAARVMATLRDHTAGKTLPWAMFGLAARVPADFALDTFSFRPGHYRMTFWRSASGGRSGRVPVGKGPGVRLDFERFAPASVLLKGTTLEAWCRDRLAHAPPTALPVEGGPGLVSWCGEARTSLLRRALRRVVRTRGRAWTTDAGNAVLAVTATGTAPLAESAFNDICGSFILVPEEAA